MGATASAPGLPPNGRKPGPSPVVLHIYDVGQSKEVRYCNKVLRTLGTGIFHCGVEVHGHEWSYEGRGIFQCRPRQCEGHAYVESLPVGVTSLAAGQVFQLVAMLSKDWQGSAYDLLRHNCCHFCNDLCQWLGVGSVPSWVMNLAGAGALVVDTRDNVELCCTRSSTVCLPTDDTSGVVGNVFSCSPCVVIPGSESGKGMQAMHVAKCADAPSPLPYRASVKVTSASRGGIDAFNKDSRGSTASTASGAKDGDVMAICDGCYGSSTDPSQGEALRPPRSNILLLDGGSNWMEEDSNREDSRQIILDPLEQDRGFHGGIRRMSVPEVIAMKETAGVREAAELMNSFQPVGGKTPRMARAR